jgi:hypothetical protein
VRRLQPKRVAVCRGLPSQYFKAISASKARRFHPVRVEAAKRKSAMGDGVSG